LCSKGAALKIMFVILWFLGNVQFWACFHKTGSINSGTGLE
jgi:hypothetical protein